MGGQGCLAIHDTALTDSDKRIKSTTYGEEALTAHTAVIGMLWRVLESYGIDPAQAVPERMYRPGAEIAENSYISLQEYYDLVGRMLALVDDEAAGITTAGLMHPSHLGVFGHAWIASPSLIASCRMLVRFGRVFFGDLRVELREHPGVIEICYDPHSVSPYPDIDADAQVGGFVKFCRMQYGAEFNPLSVTLRRPEPRQREIWDEFFGVRVEFGAAENLSRIDSIQAYEILTTAHTALFEKHQQSLAKSSIALEDADVITRVRLAIQQLLPSGAVSEERVANIVDVNSRTLHRRLSENGETFSSLLKEVRMQLAERHLVKDNYNVTEVAFMLGYSDSSAFSRAFKSWFGISPSQFRSAQVTGRRGFVDRGL